MSTRRAFIPQRKRIYIGCEGESEQSYCAMLQAFALEAGLHVHLVVEVLGPGAGDPLARVEMAISRLKQLNRKRGAPKDRFVLLDTDQIELDRGRADRAIALAARNSIAIVWQEPCFEAMLLRHLPDRAGHRPPDTQGANRSIERDWPEYRKPMDSDQLGMRIDLTGVRQAGTVEASLQILLQCVGLVGRGAA